MSKQLRLSCVFISLALIIGVFSYLRLLDTYELNLLDLRFKARPRQQINPHIAIIEIGNDTLTKLGYWPLPRDYHASLIKVLSECGVKAIIFDVLFSEPAKADEFLVEASSRANNVYYPYALSLDEKKAYLWQAKNFDARLLPVLAKAAKATGHANILIDSDGKRRRIPLLINYQDKLLPQLSLKAACDYLGISAAEIKVFPGRFVQLGEFLRIPVDQEAATLVNLSGTWKQTFKHYSYCDILLAYANRDEAPAGQLPLELAQLKNKVCFVGLTATGTADLSPNALEPVYPLVGLHANLFNSIVTKSFLRRLERWPNLAILYFLCLVTIFLSLKTRPLAGILFQLGLLVLFAAFGFLLFILAGVWIDLFFPLAMSVSLYLGTNIFRYIQELRNRELLEKELSIARNIQRSFLQELPEKLAGASVAVDMETAHHVGGDLYDFIQLPDGRVGLMVGDVSGKGVPAALFMAQVISQFRNFANTCSSPAETLNKLNQSISRESKSGLFVTIVYLIYNPANRQAIFASAGHLPALVFRNSQLIEKVEVSEGMPVGLIEETGFTEKELKLEQGDLVLLYTDGLTEARDKKAEEFQEARIIQAVADREGLSSQQAIQALKSSVKAFVGRAAQHDDITIMTLQVV